MKIKTWLGTKSYITENNIFKKIIILKNAHKITRRNRDLYFQQTDIIRLHGDQLLIQAVTLLKQCAEITSVIETGTYKGWTTELLADLFPELQIYSVEIDKVMYKHTSTRLSHIPNIRTYNNTSPRFLNRIIDANVLGEQPLFFLDAHWGDNWVLEKEIKIITTRMDSAIIIIDDFKVPGDICFGYDKGGGYSTFDNRECSLDLIIPSLDRNNEYKLIFPHYNNKDAFLDTIPHHSSIVGYPIIFQNMTKAYDKFRRSELSKQYFIDKSDLLDDNIISYLT